MKKILIWLLLAFILASIGLASTIKECARYQASSELPCRVISSYYPSTTCESYNITVFNSAGVSVANYTWSNYTPVCSFNFSITSKGTYVFNSSVETGTITVQEDSNMMIGLAIGIMGIVGLLMWLAFKLDEQFGILKLILIFVSVSLMTLIPAIFITENVNIIFNKAMMIFVVIFWLYVAAHFVYWLYQKMRDYVPK